MRSTALMILAAGVVLVAFPRPVPAQDEFNLETATKTFVAEGDSEARIRAGAQIAARDPEALAEAVDAVVKEGREGDAKVLAGVAVKVKPPHVRLLLVWGASKLTDPVSAFQSMIDNDHPMESVRAIEALGYLADPAAVEKLEFLVRGSGEIIAVEAARALCRVATKKQAKDLLALTLEVDDAHVRQHMAFAMRDVLGSTRQAIGMLGRYKGKRGTEGFRAQEAIAFLEDDETPPQKFKVKLDKVKEFFGSRRGVKAPPIDGPSEWEPGIEKSLELLKKQAPDWYHFVCVVLKEIRLSGNEQIFDFGKRSLNLRLRDMINWKDKEGELRLDLANYYIIRFTTIIFYEVMGNIGEGHRGWEKGIMAGWDYAMDYTTIAVDEDPAKFLHTVIDARPPPW